MKISGICKFLAAIMVIGTAALWTIEAGAAAPGEFPKLPELELQQCVMAERSIKPNPFSRFRNDFFMITKYEEYRDTGPEKKEFSARDSAKALNAYLVLGVFMAEDTTMALVHHMGLIVAERNIDASRGAEPTLRRWILLDQDGDSRLDKATFSQSVNATADENAGLREVEIPSEQVASLQGYFEKAVGMLSKKAAADPANACSES